MKSNSLLFALAASCSFAATAQKKQPNILWIITDDHRADALECYNRATTGRSESSLGYVSSPNIDRLAKEGVLFVNTFCNSPMSCVSRASMHSGRYAFRSGSYKFFAHQEADFVKPMVSQILRTNGYGTAVFGKTHFGIASKLNAKERKETDMFDLTIELNRDLQKKGFGDIVSAGGKYDFIDGILGVVYQSSQVYYPDGTSQKFMINNRDGEIPAKDIAIRKEVDEKYDVLRAYTRLNNTLIIGGESTKKAGETVDGYIVKEFVNYLKNKNEEYKTYGGRKVKGADTNKPLFVNIGFHLPHTPVLPPKEFRDRFKNKQYKLPEFSTEELSSFPPQLVTLYNECKADGLKEEEKLQAIQDYYAFCAYGDQLIGDAVSEFKKYCKANGQEYLILFTVGDHGWQLGEQGIMAKFGPWKQSIHNATIAVSSDKSVFPAKQVCTTLTEYVDFAPTMLSVAGIDVSSKEYDYLDGYSLVDVVANKYPEREYAIGEINVVCGHRAYMRGKDFAFSMRSRDMWDDVKAPNQNKDITWALTCDRPKADMALYDLRVDPLEKVNLAGDHRYKALADWFRNKLGTIVLGDMRVECDWTLKNSYNISSFARGADDKKLDIPKELIPALNTLKKDSPKGEE